MNVLFDELDMFENGFKLFSWTIHMPEPQYTFIEVPGRDGALDCSELDGVMHYKERTVSLAFSKVDGYSNWFNSVANISRFLHGQKRKMIVSYDPNYYYTGRFSVEPTKENAVIGDIIISGMCSPYKLKLYKTIVEQDIVETAVITLTNECMPTMPSVTTDSEMTLEFDHKSVVVNAGTKLIPDLLLLAGEKQITVTGTGHIKFEYQEGAL